MAARALALFVPLLVAACAGVLGLGDYTILVTPDDAAIAPDGAPVPGGIDAGSSCFVLAEGLTAAATRAAHVSTPPTIDGNLGEWTCGFTSMDAQNAARTIGTPKSSAEFAVQWDETGIYYACHDYDPNPEGTNPQSFENDACELYLGLPPPDDAGAYRPSNHHFGIDYKNFAQELHTATGALPPGMLTAASKVADGFVAELFIPASVLGYTPSAGMAIAFDAQIDDDQANVSQVGILFAYSNPAPDLATCATAILHQPACDTRMWGELDLSP